MKRNLLFLIVVAVFAVNSVFAAPVSLANSSAGVVASIIVNGKTETVTRQEVSEKMAEYKAGGINATEDEIVEVLVNDKVFMLSAERDGVYVSESEIDDRMAQIKNQLEMGAGRSVTDDEFNKYLLASTGSADILELREQVRELILVDKYVRTKRADDLEKTISVTDDDVKSFYRKNKSSFVTPEYVRVSHIFIKKLNNDVEDAKAKRKLVNVLEDINNGSISFEKAVKQYSEDESSKQRGGDIGSIAASYSEQLGDEFIDVAFGLDDGEISDEVVESPVGYHILKVLAHEDQKFLAIDDYVSPDSSMTVREYIRSGLQQEKEQANYADVVNKFVEDLKKSAKITYKNK